MPAQPVSAQNYSPYFPIKAVIDESVTAFVPDKRQAVREQARAVRPGGAVGLNDATWIEPPPEMVKYVALIMAGADFETVEGWRALLAGAARGSSASTFPQRNWPPRGVCKSSMGSTFHCYTVTARYPFVAMDWARQWPCEEVWKARRCT